MVFRDCDHRINKWTSVDSAKPADEWNKQDSAGVRNKMDEGGRVQDEEEGVLEGKREGGEGTQ